MRANGGTNVLPLWIAVQRFRVRRLLICAAEPALHAALRLPETSPPKRTHFFQADADQALISCADAHRLTVDILWHRACDRHWLTPRWVFPSIHAVLAREVAADDDVALFRIYGRILPSGDEGLDDVDLVAVTVVLKRSTADNRKIPDPCSLI